jgi:hypothetical protein
MEKSRNVHRTDTMVTNVNRNEHLEMDFNFLKSEIPEDPAYSTPDGSNFFIFSRRYVRDTMCNSVFFFQIYRVHFHTI